MKVEKSIWLEWCLGDFIVIERIQSSLHDVKGKNKGNRNSP